MNYWQMTSAPSHFHRPNRIGNRIIAHGETFAVEKLRIGPVCRSIEVCECRSDGLWQMGAPPTVEWMDRNINAVESRRVGALRSCALDTHSLCCNSRLHLVHVQKSIVALARLCDHGAMLAAPLLQRRSRYRDAPNLHGTISYAHRVIHAMQGRGIRRETRSWFGFDFHFRA